MLVSARVYAMLVVRPSIRQGSLFRFLCIFSTSIRKQVFCFATRMQRQNPSIRVIKEQGPAEGAKKRPKRAILSLSYDCLWLKNEIDNKRAAKKKKKNTIYVYVLNNFSSCFFLDYGHY